MCWWTVLLEVLLVIVTVPAASLAWVWEVLLELSLVIVTVAAAVLVWVWLALWALLVIVTVAAAVLVWVWLALWALLVIVTVCVCPDDAVFAVFTVCVCRVLVPGEAFNVVVANGNSPLVKFGKLNVVEPSPAPYLSPIKRYKALYVVRETAVPSQVKKPVGGARDEPPQAMIEPVGATPVAPVAP